MKDHPPYPTIPEVILLLGTDASGKDHLANLLENLIAQEGGSVEKRRRFFSAAASTSRSSVSKGFFDFLQEKTFLWMHRFTPALLPPLLCWLSWHDLRRYRPPVDTLVVVGHNGLRGLAFCLGRSEKTAQHWRIPQYWLVCCEQILRRTRVHTVILDVSDEIRQKRIRARSRQGKADTFDRYMAADSGRSERIEACLVRLATETMAASLIVNDDLSEQELTSQLRQGFAKWQQRWQGEGGS